MILKIFCIKLNILKNIYLSIKYFFKDLKLHLHEPISMKITTVLLSPGCYTERKIVIHFAIF
jgi:hypothetical protein